MALKMVKIVHKELKLESEVLPEAVPGWELNGWTTAENESKEEEPPAAPEKTESPVVTPAAPKSSAPSAPAAGNKKE